METCYKMFVRDVANRLDLQSRDFGIEPEITCKVARMRARVWEVPISYSGRTYEEGKKIGLKDAFKAVWTLMKYARWEAPQHDVGAITLRRMATLAPYNRWLHDRFEHHLGSRILEVGSGVGNQTRFFVDARDRVVASDIEPHYVRELAGRFGDRPNIRIASYRFPLSPEDLTELHNERIDTIVCMNVLEHIEDDGATLTDFARVLQPGGHLVLLVPAMKALYGTLDEHLNHFRRYDLEELRSAVTAAGFEIETLRFLNRPAVAGWWLSSRILKRRVMPKGQLRFFRWIMPLLKLEEKNPPGFGLSLLVLARKT
jgi:SAM-dependent methyltransferase